MLNVRVLPVWLAHLVLQRLEHVLHVQVRKDALYHRQIREIRRTVGQVLPDRGIQQNRILCYEKDPEVSWYEDRALIWKQSAGDQPHEGVLARAMHSHQGDNPPQRDMEEADVLEELLVFLVAKRIILQPSSP